MRLLMIPLALAALAGCQSMSYQEETGDNAARVIFTSDNVAAQPMVCVPGRGFVPTEYSLSQKPFDSDVFSDINRQMKKVPEVSVQVPAGTGLTIGVKYDRPSGGKGTDTRDRCRVAVHFRPEANHTYQAHFVRPGDQCGLAITGEDGAVISDAVLNDWQCR